MLTGAGLVGNPGTIELHEPVVRGGGGKTDAFRTNGGIAFCHSRIVGNEFLFEIFAAGSDFSGIQVDKAENQTAKGDLAVEPESQAANNVLRPTLRLKLKKEQAAASASAGT